LKKRIQETEVRTQNENTPAEDLGYGKTEELVRLLGEASRLLDAYSKTFAILESGTEPASVYLFVLTPGS
jgi:hypothetical protein